mmetsp:Transcript_36043/g.67116  ORF Transcript_36043/g.67116 Transcript_36043/m.67116 type:complete len:107 (-) Transcript_36043:110-430(-)
MSGSLKDKLEADLSGKVAVELDPVDSSDGKPKVYKIQLDDDVFFDWSMTPPGPPKVEKAPNESWQTPLNFTTHEKFFGPGLGAEGDSAKQAMYETLKESIEKKASA